jgi:hypothetical protein
MGLIGRLFSAPYRQPRRENDRAALSKVTCPVCKGVVPLFSQK